MCSWQCWRVDRMCRHIVGASLIEPAEREHGGRALRENLHAQSASPPLQRKCMEASLFWAQARFTSQDSAQTQDWCHLQCSHSLQFSILSLASMALEQMRRSFSHFHWPTWRWNTCNFSHLHWPSGARTREGLTPSPATMSPEHTNGVALCTFTRQTKAGTREWYSTIVHTRICQNGCAMS